MAKRRTAAEISAAYYKNRKRIQNQLSYWRKLGVEFPDDIIPPIPQGRIKASDLKQLEDLNRYRILSMGRAVNPETGEIITARQLSEIRRSEAQIERIYGDRGAWNLIIDNITRYYLSFGYNLGRRLINEMNRLILTYGKRRVAIMYEKAPDRFEDYLDSEGFSSDEAIATYYSSIVNYIPGLKEDERKKLEEEYDRQQ